MHRKYCRPFKYNHLNACEWPAADAAIRSSGHASANDIQSTVDHGQRRRAPYATFGKSSQTVRGKCMFLNKKNICLEIANDARKCHVTRPGIAVAKRRTFSMNCRWAESKFAIFFWWFETNSLLGCNSGSDSRRRRTDDYTRWSYSCPACGGRFLSYSINYL